MPSEKSHFAILNQTPEGRAQLAEWRSRRTTTPKRPFGAIAGWTKHMREKALAHAMVEAKQLVNLMEQKGYNIPKDEYAREGIEAVVAMVRLTDISPKDRLAAARTLLDFTMAKPATTINQNVKKAEDFLADLAAELPDTE